MPVNEVHILRAHRIVIGNVKRCHGDARFIHISTCDRLRNAFADVCVLTNARYNRLIQAHTHGTHTDHMQLDMVHQLLIAVGIDVAWWPGFVQT